jgi:hypothetical protein
MLSRELGIYLVKENKGSITDLLEKGEYMKFVFRMSLFEQKPAQFCCYISIFLK